MGGQVIATGLITFARDQNPDWFGPQYLADGQSTQSYSAVLAEVEGKEIELEDWTPCPNALSGFPHFHFREKR